MNSNDLRNDLMVLLNKASRENNSNTPDFLLAGYLMTCLEAYETAVMARDKWYGISPMPGMNGLTRK